jgi:hypothetical protein
MKGSDDVPVYLEGIGGMDRCGELGRCACASVAAHSVKGERTRRMRKHDRLVSEWSLTERL